MTQIIQGMTSEEFITAVNSNSASVLSRYTTINNTMNGIDIQDALNYGFSSTYNLIGIKGSNFVSIINNNFNSYDISLSKPTNLSVTWINDFAQITFVDNSGGVAQTEIWEKKNDGVYALVHTLAEGVVTYDYYTWQNANLSFKIRSKQGSSYSEFTSVVTISTPLVFKTNQSSLSTLTFYQLRMTLGKSINVNWGDGTSTNYSNNNYEYNVVTKSYSTTQNPYYVTISGDINYIIDIQLYNQPSAYGDLSKWILPTSLTVFHFYSNSFSGDNHLWFENMPANIYIMHVGNNYFSGDLTNTVFPNGIDDFHISGNTYTADITNWVFPNSFVHNAHMVLGANLTGNITNLVFPTGLKWFNSIGSNLTGDITNLIIPSTLSAIDLSLLEYPTSLTGDLSNLVFATTVDQYVGFYMRFANCNFTGSLANSIIPVGVADGKQKVLDFRNNHLTGLPRGCFKDVNIYQFEGNNCNTAEIDSLLTYIDTYFTGGVVPLVNCAYTLNGTGMGVPSSTGLAARTSIINKYTSAGFTATILVN